MILIWSRTTKCPKYACSCYSIKYLLFFFASLTVLFLSFPCQSCCSSGWVVAVLSPRGGYRFPGEEMLLRDKPSVAHPGFAHTRSPGIFLTSLQPIPSHWGSLHPISWCTPTSSVWAYSHSVSLLSCSLALLLCSFHMFHLPSSFLISGKNIMPGINFLPLKTVQSKDLGRCCVSSVCRPWVCAPL